VKGTHASLTVAIRIADIEHFRLLVWELWELWAAMRLVNDPNAEILERILNRLADEHEVDTT
jgi:hypothetical protein